MLPLKTVNKTKMSTSNQYYTGSPANAVRKKNDIKVYRLWWNIKLSMLLEDIIAYVKKKTLA